MSCYHDSRRLDKLTYWEPHKLLQLRCSWKRTLRAGTDWADCTAVESDKHFGLPAGSFHQTVSQFSLCIFTQNATYALNVILVVSTHWTTSMVDFPTRTIPYAHIQAEQSCECDQRRFGEGFGEGVCTELRCTELILSLKWITST
jgi:hypothetical protein